MKTQSTNCRFMLKIEFTMIILATLLASNHSIAQFKTRFIDIHIDGFGKPNVQSNNKISANQYGVGANVSVGGKYFNTVLEYNYNQVDFTQVNANTKTNINFSEFYMGVRYFPIRPTFLMGKTAVRLTARYLYGFDMEPNWKSLIMGGLAFSSVTNTSGISLNFIYRPDTYTVKSYTLESTYLLRLGFVFGPKG